jgi:hypothetical protein
MSWAEVAKKNGEFRFSSFCSLLSLFFSISLSLYSLSLSLCLFLSILPFSLSFSLVRPFLFLLVVVRFTRATHNRALLFRSSRPGMLHTHTLSFWVSLSLSPVLSLQLPPSRGLCVFLACYFSLSCGSRSVVWDMNLVSKCLALSLALSQHILGRKKKTLYVAFSPVSTSFRFELPHSLTFPCGKKKHDEKREKNTNPLPRPLPTAPPESEQPHPDQALLEGQHFEGETPAQHGISDAKVRKLSERMLTGSWLTVLLSSYSRQVSVIDRETFEHPAPAEPIKANTLEPLNLNSSPSPNDPLNTEPRTSSSAPKPSDAPKGSEIKVPSAEEAGRKVDESVEKGKRAAKDAERKVERGVEEAERKAEKAAENVERKAKEVKGATKQLANDAADKTRELADEAADKTKEVAHDVEKKAKQLKRDAKVRAVCWQASMSPGSR